MKYQWTFFIVLLAWCTSGSVFAADETEASDWTFRQKNGVTQTCYSQSVLALQPHYQQMFLGKLSEVEYEAFFVANNQQVLQSCQCIINRVSAEYSFAAFAQNGAEVQALATDLTQVGGPCATNLVQLVSDINARTAAARRAGSQR